MEENHGSNRPHQPLFYFFLSNIDSATLGKQFSGAPAKRFPLFRWCHLYSGMWMEMAVRAPRFHGVLAPQYAQRGKPVGPDGDGARFDRRVAPSLKLSGFVRNG